MSQPGNRMVTNATHNIPRKKLKETKERMLSQDRHIPACLRRNQPIEQTRRVFCVSTNNLKVAKCWRKKRPNPKLQVLRNAKDPKHDYTIDFCLSKCRSLFRLSAAKFRSSILCSGTSRSCSSSPDSTCEALITKVLSYCFLEVQQPETCSQPCIVPFFSKDLSHVIHP